MAGLPPDSAAASAIDIEPALFEQLGFVSIYAGIAQSHMETRDFAGLAYSVRQLVARTRFVAGVLNDLGKSADSKSETR
ncbi:hypothetical protein [Bosea sp. NBC_00550]|uniref:hypothetical protein n=1 Tax=Bosea sp. NBC_00550 TaxID=2969621 RepID=UPI0022317158|nr:hypothetical protein [Bosea sp. NBC_00550]UZF90414.1 hypothetical protein NWE53_14775 [Bosea sp. NBC_00550]